MTAFTKGNNRAAKLNPGIVQDIRELYGRGDCTQGQLARDYGVSIVQIGRIVRGEVWQSVKQPEPSAREIENSAQRMLAVQRRVEEPAESFGVSRLQVEAAEHFRGDAMVRELRNPLDE
mgnify:CR=1 FL=1